MSTPHEVLARDMHALIDRRQFPENQTACEDVGWLDDPERSFVAFLDSIADETPFLAVDTEQGTLNRIAYRNTSTTDLAKHLGYQLHLLAFREGTSDHGNEQKILQIAIRLAQKHMLKSDRIEDQLTGCDVLGYIAAYVKPADVKEGAVLKKHKNETPREQTFRMAVNVLQNFSDQPPTRADQEAASFMGRIRAYPKLFILADSAKVQDAVTKTNLLQVKNVATRIRSLVLSEAVSAELFDKELDAWEQRLNDVSTDRQLGTDIPIKETKWTILPPAITEQLGLSEPESANSRQSATESSPRLVHEERLIWLGRLAATWGHDAYIAVANLDSSGNYDYRVAVLPQTMPDGTVIEHAVAENQSDREDAAFGFRAERGLDDHGVWLTWRDVFQDSKRDAVALGARRMLHVPTLQDNVVEYLTRPASELDRRGYKR